MAFQFHETIIGHRTLTHTLPEIARSLASIEKSLKIIAEKLEGGAGSAGENSSDGITKNTS